MTIFTNDNEAIIKCQCDLLEHTICISDLEDDFFELCILPQPKTFKEKMVLIWKVLCGKEVPVYDIVIKAKDIHDLSDWVALKVR